MVARNPHALWAEIPEHLRPGIARWLIHGIEPGSFLRAAITGSLCDAAKLADDIAFEKLGVIGLFLSLYAPDRALHIDWRISRDDETRWFSVCLCLEDYPGFASILQEAAKL